MVEEIKGALYAFGSELACLRLEHIMRTGRADYSIPRQSWVYCLDRATQQRGRDISAALVDIARPA